MQIRSNLSTLMGTYRYNIKDVHDKTGLARGTLSNFYYARDIRVDFDILSKLCSLFHCVVGTLLIIEKDEISDASAVFPIINGGKENE